MKNLQEMSLNEMKETEGGFLPLLLLGAAALALVGCASRKPLDIQQHNINDSIKANQH